MERYRSRISGPLLDRIDMHVEVPAVTLDEMRGRSSEKSAAVAARVHAARDIQRRRFADGCGTPINAALEGDDLDRACHLEDAARRLLETAFERLHLSARALQRIRKLARTIADLEGSELLRPAHVAEAIQYRTLDRRLQRV